MWERVRGVFDEAFARLGAVLAADLPGIVAMLVVVLGAILAAFVVRAVLRFSLARVGFDRRAREWGMTAGRALEPHHEPSWLVARGAFWLVVATGVALALAVLGASTTSLARPLAARASCRASWWARWCSSAGSARARFLERGVLIGAVNQGIGRARLVAWAVKWIVFVLAAAMALQHVGIGGSLPTIAFTIVVGRARARRRARGRARGARRGRARARARRRRGGRRPRGVRAGAESTTCDRGAAVERATGGAGSSSTPPRSRGRTAPGDLGAAAHRFARWLSDAGQRLWQVLPLGPTGFGDSPYQALSSRAGNPLLVSLEVLAREGWLEDADLAGAPAGDPGARRARARRAVAARAARPRRAGVRGRRARRGLGGARGVPRPRGGAGSATGRCSRC